MSGNPTYAPETPPPRIISRLDIKGPNVIKGIHLEGLRVVGPPGEMARTYYRDQIDEIIYMDTVASLYGRNSILPIIEEAAREVFIPITVGGGIRSVADAVAALRSGADKVAINTAAIARPDLIREASKALGSQCIVVSIEAKRRGDQKWEALTDNGREPTGVDVMEWARKAEDLGAGEILVTSVDMEGTRKGFDHDLFKAVRKQVDIPIIGCGGAGHPSHIVNAFKQDGLDAIACASIFHYRHWVIQDLKNELKTEGIPVRGSFS